MSSRLPRRSLWIYLLTIPAMASSCGIFVGLTMLWQGEALGLVLVLACALVLWLYFREYVRRYQRRMAQIRMGRCIGCDYDLWGSVMGGQTRCPECGREISEQTIRRIKLLRSEDNASG